MSATNDRPDNERVISSTVEHGGKSFFVSTINRYSSSQLRPDHRYAETIVWAWSWETRARGAMLWQGSDCENNIRTHQAAVERIHATGSPEEPDNDE